MTKKRLILLSTGVLVALLVASVIGVAVVSAEEPTPEPPGTHGWCGGGLVRKGFGRGMLGRFGGGWTMFDTAAEALGLTPEEFFGELHDGKSLDEIADAKGVDLEAIQDAVKAAQAEAQKAAIEQAVEDGNITQEQADWMLEGLEKGFMPRRRGFGRGLRWGRSPSPPPESA